MKLYILPVVISVFLSCAAYAQSYNYVLTRGKTVSSVSWVETGASDGGKKIEIHVGDNIFNQLVDATGKTYRWHYTSEKDKTDYEVVLKDGVYSIKGIVNGRDVNRTDKSKGYSWYQNISYKAGPILKHKGESLTYECIRVDNGSLTAMIVTNMGQESINGKVTNHLKVTPAGALSKLWSCHEYCDPDTGVLISYRAVEGVPGTPETVWMIK